MGPHGWHRVATATTKKCLASCHSSFWQSYSQDYTYEKLWLVSEWKLRCPSALNAARDDASNDTLLGSDRFYSLSERQHGPTRCCNLEFLTCFTNNKLGVKIQSSNISLTKTVYCQEYSLLVTGFLSTAANYPPDPHVRNAAEDEKGGKNRLPAATKKFNSVKP